MTTPRIDSHQHFWRYNASEFGWIDESMAVLRRDFSPTDLRTELDTNGLDGCIAVQAPQTLAETRTLLAHGKAHPWIRGVVGWVDLQSTDVEAQLREFSRDARFVGVRHIAQAEAERFLVSEPFLRGLAALAPYDLVYDLLVYPHQIPDAIELVARFPGQRFVLDHLGKPDLRLATRDDTTWSQWVQNVRSLALHPNVACKLSGLVTEADWANRHGTGWNRMAWPSATLQPAFDVALAAFGPRRLLFGSDWPVCLCASSYARWVETVTAWVSQLAEPDRAAVFGGTAVRWYHLPRRLP